MAKEEYEVIPLDPLRAMEKRIKKLEEVLGEKAMGQEYIELVKTNQEVVGDLIKMNTGIIDKLASVSSLMEGLIKRIDEFMSKFDIEVEIGSAEGGKLKALEEENQRLKETQEELLDKLSKLEKKINMLILSKVPLRKPIKPPIQSVSPRA